MKGCKIFFMICWKCGKEISVEKVTRMTECPLCGCDLHSCKGCRFYDKSSHYECRENVDFPVTDKERANFCDSFSAGVLGTNNIAASSADDKAKKARDLFNSLFD